MANAPITVPVQGNLTPLERQLRNLEIKGINVKFNSQPLGQISGQVSEFSKSMEAANARVIAFGASAGIINQVTNALEAMVSESVNVEKQLVDINSILNTSDQGLKDFGASLFDIAKQTGTSFNEVAGAAKELARQGLSAETTLTRTRDAMTLARLSGDDVGKSLQSLTAIVNAFTQEALTSTDAVNRLANVDAHFAVSTADLSTALSRVGAVAQDAKVPFNELIAIVTAVQQRTARGGATIGEALKTIFTRVTRNDTLEQLQNLGIAVQDVGGHTLSTNQILQQFARTYDTLSDSQKTSTAELLGGVRQVNILKTYIRDLTSDYSVYKDALDTANNTTDEAITRNARLNQTIAALTNASVANFAKFAAAGGKAVFGPTIEKVFGGFNKASDYLSDTSKRVAGGSDQASTGEKLGAELGAGLLKGIGNALSGPGLVVGGFVAAKLFAGFTKFSLDAAQKVLGIGQASEKVATVQRAINDLLVSSPKLYDAIISKSTSLAEAEQTILGYIREQIAAKEQLSNLSLSSAKGLVESGELTVSKGAVTTRKKAGGYIPNLVEASIAADEVRGAKAQGYNIAPNEVRQMNAQIDGVPSQVVYNTRERVIHNYAGSGEPAIIPPNKTINDLFREKHFAGGGLPLAIPRKTNLDKLLDFTSSLGIKKPIGLIDADMVSYINSLPPETLNKELSGIYRGSFAGAFPVGRKKSGSVAELLIRKNFKFNEGFVPNLAGLEFNFNKLNPDLFLKTKNLTHEQIGILQEPNLAVFTSGLGGHLGDNPIIPGSNRLLKKSFEIGGDTLLKDFIEQFGKNYFPHGIGSQVRGIYELQPTHNIFPPEVQDARSKGKVYENFIAEQFGLSKPSGGTRGDIRRYEDLQKLREFSGNIIPADVTEGEIKLSPFEIDKRDKVTPRGPSAGFTHIVSNSVKKYVNEVFSSFVPAEELEKFLSFKPRFNSSATNRDLFREQYKHFSLASGYVPSFAINPSEQLLGSGTFRNVYSHAQGVLSNPRSVDEVYSTLKQYNPAFSREDAEKYLQREVTERPKTQKALGQAGLGPKVFKINGDGSFVAEKIEYPTIKQLLDREIISREEASGLLQKARQGLSKAGFGKLRDITFNNVAANINTGKTSVLDFLAKGFVPNLANQISGHDAIHSGLADNVSGLRESLQRETTNTGVGLSQTRVNFLNKAGLPPISVTNTRDEGASANPLIGFDRVKQRGGNIFLAGSGKEYSRGHIPNLALPDDLVQNLLKVYNTTPVTDQDRQRRVDAEKILRENRILPDIPAGYTEAQHTKDVFAGISSKKLTDGTSDQAADRVARAERYGKYQNLALTASFAAPVLASTFAQFTSNPQQQRGISEVGNALGVGGSIASVAASGGPATLGPGFAVAGLVTAFLGLKAVINNLSPSLEDMAKKSQTVAAKQQAEASATQELIQAQSQLKDVQRVGGSPTQIRLAQDRVSEAYNKINDPTLRQNLRNAGDDISKQEDIVAQHQAATAPALKEAEFNTSVYQIAKEKEPFIALSLRSGIAAREKLGLSNDLPNEADFKKYTNEEIQTTGRQLVGVGASKNLSSDTLDSISKQIAAIDPSASGARNSLKDLARQLGVAQSNVDALSVSATKFDLKPILQSAIEFSRLSESERQATQRLVALNFSLQNFTRVLGEAQIASGRLQNLRTIRLEGASNLAENNIRSTNNINAPFQNEVANVRDEYQLAQRTNENTRIRGVQENEGRLRSSLLELPVDKQAFTDINQQKEFRDILSKAADPRNNPVDVAKNINELIEKSGQQNAQGATTLNTEGVILRDKVVNLLGELVKGNETLNENQKNANALAKQAAQNQLKQASITNLTSALRGTSISQDLALDTTTSRSGFQATLHRIQLDTDPSAIRQQGLEQRDAARHGNLGPYLSARRDELGQEARVKLRGLEEQKELHNIPTALDVQSLSDNGPTPTFGATLGVGASVPFAPAGGPGGLNTIAATAAGIGAGLSGLTTPNPLKLRLQQERNNKEAEYRKYTAQSLTQSVGQQAEGDADDLLNSLKSDHNYVSHFSPDTTEQKIRKAIQGGDYETAREGYVTLRQNTNAAGQAKINEYATSKFTSSQFQQQNIPKQADLLAKQWIGSDKGPVDVTPANKAFDTLNQSIAKLVDPSSLATTNLDALTRSLTGFATEMQWISDKVKIIQDASNPVLGTSSSFVGATAVPSAASVNGLSALGAAVSGAGAAISTILPTIPSAVPPVTAPTSAPSVNSVWFGDDTKPVPTPTPNAQANNDSSQVLQSIQDLMENLNGHFENAATAPTTGQGGDNAIAATGRLTLEANVRVDDASTSTIAPKIVDELRSQIAQLSNNLNIIADKNKVIFPPLQANV